MDEKETDIAVVQGATGKTGLPVSEAYCRAALIISLIGLMTSVVFGIGGILSVVSFAMAAAKYGRAKRSTLKWTMVVSAVTIAVCIVYVFAIFVALASGASHGA